MNCWICWEPDEDRDDILKEFEKMLNDEDNSYQMPEKTYTASPDHCKYHRWELVGRSPVLDDPWYNCEKCGMPKEEYEKETNQRPLL